MSRASSHRIVEPPRDQLGALKPALTPGELEVFEFFDRLLVPEWEIYVQPFLNGLRPDFVLLNPQVGIAVFEVKDWKLGGSGPEKRRSPLSQVRQYGSEIRDLYCPRLDGPGRMAAVTAGVIFTRASTEAVQELLRGELGRLRQSARPYHPVSGADALSGNRLDEVFPDANREHSSVMSRMHAEDLRVWLVEPRHAKEQRTPPKLDATARPLVTDRTPSGYRRIRGPAGSGKTTIVAGRAAHLEQGGGEVLVVSYNHTLVNLLADTAASFGARRTRITWLGFHEWCKRTMKQAGCESWYDSLATADRKDWLDDPIAEATLEAVQRGPSRADVPRYDAVLVDEGQDFRPSWWAALRSVCRDGGEMLLAADRGQDLYRRGTAWTQGVMEQAGFSGRWTTLGTSHRLPTPVAELAGELLRVEGRPAHEFPQPDPQEALDFVERRWQQVEPGEVTNTTFEEAARFLAGDRTRPLAGASDVILIFDDRVAGLEVVEKLRGKKLDVLSTFAADETKERALKKSFYRGNATVKATTIHSYKGYESPTVIVVVTSYDPILLYIAMTRVLRTDRGSRLSVICANERFREFGRRMNGD